MQKTVEVIYRKAQMIDPDANKARNLGLCLINQARFAEAHSFVQNVPQSTTSGPRIYQIKKPSRGVIAGLTVKRGPSLLSNLMGLNIEEFIDVLDQLEGRWACFGRRVEDSAFFFFSLNKELSNFKDQLGRQSFIFLSLSLFFVGFFKK
ncbi:hypothetical protein Ancab_019809 [Ancistrocladus abbreviatus]